jgi:DNA processing protein
LLFYTDKDYPNRLKSIADAPALLYYKGNANLNTDKTVAIVGTRKATPYGKSITEEAVSELKKFKSLLVISGLAYGIDIAAHKSALKHNIPTLGIIANGLDIQYPSLHKNTILQMMEEGGILTEYRLGTKPDAPHFPARNRIIAGMADALIVVEAAVTGGALITADIANSYNKDVFAVPGNIGAIYSEGCNNLIKTHKASIYTGVKDLEYLMNWEENATAKNAAQIQAVAKQIDMTLLEDEEKQVVHLLQNRKEMLIDEISWQAQVPLSKLASVLLSLELQGIVKALPGKKFTLL